MERGDSGGTWPGSPLVLIPAVFGVVWFLLPFRQARGLCLVAVGVRRARRCCSRSPTSARSRTSRSSSTMTLIGFWFLTFFESVLWVALVASVIPLVDALSVWRGPTRHIVDKQPAGLHDAVVRVPDPGRAADGEPRAARSALLRALPGGGSALPAAPGLDVVRDDGLVRADDRPDGRVRRGRAAGAAAALARLPRARTPTCSGAPSSAASGASAGASEQRHRLHVRRVREHVDRRHALRARSPSRGASSLTLPASVVGLHET